LRFSALELSRPLRGRPTWRPLRYFSSLNTLDKTRRWPRHYLLASRLKCATRRYGGLARSRNDHWPGCTRTSRLTPQTRVVPNNPSPLTHRCGGSLGHHARLTGLVGQYRIGMSIPHRGSGETAPAAVRRRFVSKPSTPSPTPVVGPTSISAGRQPADMFAMPTHCV
jgi:hypothetical protein